MGPSFDRDFTATSNTRCSTMLKEATEFRTQVGAVCTVLFCSLVAAAGGQAAGRRLPPCALRLVPCLPAATSVPTPLQLVKCERAIKAMAAANADGVGGAGAVVGAAASAAELAFHSRARLLQRCLPSELGIR